MVHIITEEGAELPQYATELASGADIKAFKLVAVYKSDQEVDLEKLAKLQESFNERGFIKLRGFERAIFGTGNFIQDMSRNKEIQIRDRSGNSSKKGLKVMNSPGTIDADYRGEIKVTICNNTPFLNKIEKGQKIAQLVVAEVPHPREAFIRTFNAVTHTERGDKGFGSTGN